MMEAMFKNWLIKRGNKGAASSYPKAINQISEHYSKQTGEQIDIYKIKDQSKISALARDYSQSGKFSEFGYEQHGRYRAAIGRYSDFFVESRGEEHAIDEAPIQETDPEVSESWTQTVGQRLEPDKWNLLT